MSLPTLYIGDRAYSSWSMRPWLALVHGEWAFEEVLVRLDTVDSARRLAEISPAQTVPVLDVDGLVIWDSLAICEWAAERSRELWPSDHAARARARSTAATMHSSYGALRQEAPMDLHRTGGALAISERAEDDLKRLCALWSGQLRASGGPFLAGAWSIADAMATPYATRVRSYDLPVPPEVQDYVEALLSTDAFKAWEATARSDERRLVLFPDEGGETDSVHSAP